MNHPINRRHVLLAGAAMPFASIQAANAAETFPSKPIRLLVPYSPGGTSSLVCDLITQHLAAAKMQMYTDYKPGAGGNIGVDAVLKAPPDGYTVGFTAMNSFAINPHLTRKLPFDVARDVQLITRIGSVPNVIAVHPGVKATTLRELVEQSQQKELTYASPGSGTSPHLCGEMLIHDAGLKMLHVPYKGESPALTDVLGGRVEVMLANLTGVAEYIRSGRLRAIAVTSPERVPLLPDVPTVNESGVKGFDVRGYFVFFTSRGTPAEAVDKLNRALSTAIDSETFRKRVASVGLEASASTVEAVTALVSRESRKWGEVIRRTGTTWD